MRGRDQVAIAPKMSARRLAASLAWSLAMLTPMARDAVVRALARELVGSEEAYTGWVIGTTWTPRRLLLALGVWRWPTLPGTHRALALALAVHQVRPRLTAVA